MNNYRASSGWLLNNERATAPRFCAIAGVKHVSIRDDLHLHIKFKVWQAKQRPDQTILRSFPLDFKIEKG